MDLILASQQTSVLDTQSLLAGHVDRASLRPILRSIRRAVRSRPRTRFLLNCAQVTDFCGYALADLVDLRRQLQWQGSDLQLFACSDSVRLRLAVPLFESLLGNHPS